MVDVTIVGAGAIGLTTALWCADAGLTVRLVDPAPGRGASWAAAGMLAPVAEMHYGETALLALNSTSSRRWPAWAERLGEQGIDVGYQRCGSLLVARDADDAAELRRLLQTHEDLGLEVSWLRSRAARRAEPALAPSTRGAIRVPGDHQVDNRALVTGLLELVAGHGAIIMDRRRVASVEGRSAAGICTVGLDDGTDVQSRSVVLASGAGTAALHTPTLELPTIRPVKGQLLHLRSHDGPLAVANIRGLDCYIVNRPDGRIVVGATVEEMGHDTTVTAGGVSHLLRAAWELMPGIDECELVETTAGLRPGSPDNAPLIGWVEGTTGVIAAVGHYRNGVLLSPITAEIVTGLLTEATPAADVEVGAFSPSRFTPSSATTASA